MSKKIKTQSVTAAQSREEAVNKIAQIGVLEREILRLNAELSDKIAPLQEEYDRKIALLKDEMATLTSSCHLWCEANRAALTDNNRVKFADLSTGIVRWRINPPSVSVAQKTLAEVIDRLMERPDYHKFVRTKHEVNRELILQHPEMFENNQILGIKLKQGEEFFAIEPSQQDIGG